MNAHIERYLNMVETGELAACREQHALAKLVRNAFETEDLFVDTGQLEHYLGMSRYFGFTLFEWQEFVYALHLCTYTTDSRGNKMPRWPDLFCLQGRGAGKDGTIALEAVCLASPYNGIPAYDVDICAMNEEQAMRPVRDIIDAFETPAYSGKLKRFFQWNKETVRSLSTGSTIKGRTNNPKGKDGLRSGAVIFNEIHQYEDYKNINVFTTGLGKKPHPRRSYYSTDGDVREGPLDDMKERAAEILFGGEPDAGLLPFICKLDSEDEVHDRDMWEKAVPGLRYLPSLRAEMEKEYAEWVRSPSRLPAFMAKRFNIPPSGGEFRVTDYENIKATNRPLPDLDGSSCTAGIDYASLRDFCSVDLHFVGADGQRYDINHTWASRRSPDIVDGRVKAPLNEWAAAGLLTLVDETEIAPELIADWITGMADRYNIVCIGMDNFRFALMKKALFEAGFSVEAGNLKLTRPSDIMKVQPVIDSAFTNQLFVWGDNPVLRWATNNTKLLHKGRDTGEDTGNYYYGKIEGKSRKTDPFMALVSAMTLEEMAPAAFGELPALEIITL